MERIDQWLDHWIHSSVIRARIRVIIAKAIQESYDEGWRDSRF